jgi:hypothetical protein
MSPGLEGSGMFVAISKQSKSSSVDLTVLKRQPDAYHSDIGHLSTAHLKNTNFIRNNRLVSDQAELYATDQLIINLIRIKEAACGYGLFHGAGWFFIPLTC